MGETLEWWLGGGDWYDRRQSRQIEDARRQAAASARRVERNLRADLQATTRSLEGRIDQLEAAVGALLLLEDAREELIAYADAAAVRRYAGVAVAAVLERSGPPGDHQYPPDVATYWLGPAARAASAMVGLAPGDDVEALLAEARARDAERTDRFWVLFAGLSDGAIDAGPALERVLPANVRITTTQRAIWQATAAGCYGTKAAELLSDHLANLTVGELGIEKQIERALERTSSGQRGSGEPRPVVAGRQLAALRQFVAPAPGSTAAPLPPQYAQREASSEPSDTLDTEDPGAAGEPPLPSTKDVLAAAHSEVADALAVLVNEGAPGEQPVLDRIAAARRSLGAVGIGVPPPRQSGDQAFDELVPTLITDIEGSQAGLRRVALAALAPQILGMAELLADRAQQGIPRRLSVGDDGEVEISDDGQALTKLTREIGDGIGSADRTLFKVSVALAIVAVIGLPLAAVSPWFLLLTSIAGIACFVTYSGAKEQRTRLESLRQRDSRKRRRLQEKGRQLAKTVSEADQLRAEAPQHLATIRLAVAWRTGSATTTYVI